LVYWGIRVRMYELREQACLAVQARGGQPTAKTGMNTQKMKAWRALGRTLVDIQVLVFNCGRSDFRTKHTCAFTLMAQSSLKVGANSTNKAALGASIAMFRSIGTLIEMIGIVRLMEQLMRAPQWVVVPNGHDEVGKQTYCPVLLKQHTLWATCRTLLAHRCWRDFPTLAIRLPELLLGGTFRGVRLQSTEFDEPAPCRPAATSRPLPATGVKRAAILEHRDSRFAATLVALNRLLLWARMERRLLMEKLLGWSPGGKLVFREVDGLPRLHTDTRTAEQVLSSSNVTKQAEVDEESGEEEGASRVEEEAVKELDFRCNFPPDKRRRLNDFENDENDSDGDKHAKAGKDDHEDAALQLATACAALHTQPSVVDNEILANVVGATDELDEEACACDMTDSEEEAEEFIAPRDTLAFGSNIPTQEVAVDGPKTWVLKKDTRGDFHIMPMIVYNSQVEQSLWKHAHSRVIFQMHVDRVFGSHLLERAGCVVEEEASLAVLHAEFNGKLWGLRQGSISSAVIDNPPAEVFQPCTLSNLIDKYRHFREWVYGFRRLPYAGEFFSYG
jgi:hypothetical protein